MILGSWTRSADGGHVEQRAAMEPWSALGTWPSSGPEDVLAALEVLAEGERPWRALPRSKRLVHLVASIHELERDTSGLASRSLRLGLGADELPGLGAHGELLTDELTRRQASSESRGVTVVDVHWSELEVGLFARAGRALLDGSPVLLVGDLRLPMVADRVARALLAGGVAPACVALLHGLPRAGLQRAIGDERVTGVSASAAEPERISWLRALCDGAGTARPALRLLRAGSLEVGALDSVSDLAERTVELAFGRKSTLSGQVAGQVARVFCHERVFSQFTDDLLAALERSTAAQAPLPSIDRDSVVRVRAQWAEGLDEGATLIAGGELFGETVRPAERRLLPTVFTNVEPHMVSVARQAPMPILCLMRTKS